MPPIAPFTRRDMLVKAPVLSLASLALVSGLSAKVMAQDAAAPSQQDIDILNEILGTEHEGIAAYEICVTNGLMRKGTVKTARLFQEHHKAHRDLLISHVTGMGGTPAVAKSLNEYRDDLNTVTLKSQKEALNLIVKLERGAANAYIGMLPSTNDHELAKMAGRIAADEVLHYTTIAALLGLPLPVPALTFGA